MATYIPNATQTTEPVESRTVESAALEFRTLKTSINERIEDVQDGLDTEIVNRIAGDANLQTQNNAQDVRLLAVENALLSIGEGGLPGTVYVQRFSGTGVQTAFTLTAAPRSENVVDIYINGIYQNKDTFSVAGAVITFSEAPPAGTDNIEVQVTVTIALGETDASLVSFQQAGTGTTVRTAQDKLREWVSVKDFGAVGDGVTNDSAAVQAAVTHCLNTVDQLYWPDGTYLTTASVSDFHRVKHFGAGVVKRGSDLYYVEPKDADTNILYVSTVGTTTNDGLSAAESVTIGRAIAILKAFGSETLNGIWRIQFAAGTYNDTGVTLAEMPVFKNHLEIFGAQVNESASEVPTTIWDGSISSTVYAFRMDSVHQSNSVQLSFKNIKFTNWTNGGIVIWANGNVIVRNIHADSCPTGLWFRYGYFSVRYGIMSNCSTWGVGIQYAGTANIGSSIAGTGITFTNCADGVKAGRYAICYVEKCTFNNCGQSIVAEWSARVRPVGNTFNAPTNANVVLRGNSLLTTGPGENTLPTLTEAFPYVRSNSGSVNPDISRYGQRALHNYSGGMLETGATPVTNFNLTTTSKILLSDLAYGGPDFVPFRLPAYALYSPTFELELELGISLNANAGGTLALHGEGSAAGTKLCELVIPTVASFRTGTLKLKIRNKPNSSSARFEWFFPPTGLYSTGVTSALDDAAIRGSNDSLLLFRLYWTSATVDQVAFYDMRTYVTE